ncbi:urea amidolyase associated protein UAAP1 [Swaminathania salitolerans]|uniref:Urea carboxylase n=1 Tax=Swaminathania salitolerans TaxID=182838 RepID=A0A511BSP0_9PROT|nr:urea amidolyase associated protein UAAP1 [Swaminathania salitolerans]GBQ13140.1 urea carboxylase [Swaminathania salitolerans LMG 21291]GEL03347.1 urea carboxylase [Swaminathania salitolerans]
MIKSAQIPSTAAVLYRETIPGGGHRSLVVKAGWQLRLTACDRNANLALVAFNAALTSERLNLPDTLKAQHTAFLTKGHCLHSDMGRVLLAITEDRCGWHDCFGGVLNAVETEEKYGSGRFQDLRNAFFRNGYDNLLVELGKWDLDARDIPMVVNLFSKVAVGSGGVLRFVPDHAQPGQDVVLHALMDTLVVMTAVPHPMDPSPSYTPGSVSFAIEDASDPAALDACRRSCGENERAFRNTEIFCL